MGSCRSGTWRPARRCSATLDAGFAGSNYFREAVFSPDGKSALAAGGLMQVLFLFDPATGRHCQQINGHTASVDCVALSPDGKWALSGSQDRTMRLWDLKTGKELAASRGTRTRFRKWPSRPTANRHSRPGTTAAIPPCGT